MLSFAAPLALLLILPWLFAAWRLLRRGRSAGILFAPASRRLPKNAAGWRQHLAQILPWGFLTGSLLLIVAAAGPRTAISREIREADAVAVMMAVDISGSMSADDLSAGNQKKTRLDVVKETFVRFVEARPDDLIGLVTFGGYASTRAPLTADHRALLHVLKGVQLIDPRKLDEKGRPVSREENMTALGDGLSTALARLEKAEPKTKIVVLLTDGQNNFGVVAPKEAAEAAQKLGIRVYTIGVGDPNDRLVQDFFMTRRVPPDLDEATLREIATTTGGLYFNVTTPDALQQALEDISKLETTRVERQAYTRYKDHFSPWLLSGAALLAFAVLGAMTFTRRIV